MWEVRAHPKAVPDLLTWLSEVALPAIEVNPLHISSEMFSSAEHRVVVISRWRSNPEPIPDPPSHLVARPPYSWDFASVDR
jgi:hypothetical protein